MSTLGVSYSEMALRADEAYDRMYDFEIANRPSDVLESPFIEDRQDR
jgi:hypothetical protein